MATIITTLWHGSGISRALSEGGERVIGEVRPDIVQLHTWPASGTKAIVDKVKSILPTARIWFGIGSDPFAKEVVKDRTKLDAQVRKAVGLSKLASELGAEMIVWNAEAAWKQTDPALKALVADLAKKIQEGTEALGTIKQGHTAYDVPTYHSAYCWSAWNGAESKIALALPQVYAAPEKGVAGPGAMNARARMHENGWEQAVRKGWIRGTLQKVPYLQCHHIPAEQLIQYAAAQKTVCFWAVPMRMDSAGEKAMKAVAKIRDAGFEGENAVKLWQESKGLSVDGAVGPNTMASFGL